MAIRHGRMTKEQVFDLLRSSERTERRMMFDLLFVSNSEELEQDESGRVFGEILDFLEESKAEKSDVQMFVARHMKLLPKPARDALVDRAAVILLGPMRSQAEMDADPDYK